MAQNVVPLESKRNTLDLDLTWMLKSTLANGSLELIFKEELIPAGKVGSLVFLRLVFLRLLFIRALILRHNVSHDSLL